MRPATCGPCRASPTQRALGRSASNRPNTAGGPPSGRGRLSPSAAKWRCRVRGEGDHPACAASTTATCAAVRPGVSRLEPDRQLQHLGRGLRSQPPRRRDQRGEPTGPIRPDPAIQTRPAHPHRLRPERTRMDLRGDRPDQPAPLLGRSTPDPTRPGSGRSGTAPPPAPGPAAPPPDHVPRSHLGPSRIAARPARTDRSITSPAHGSPAQGRLVLPAHPLSRPKIRTRRGEQPTAADHRGQPPRLTRATQPPGHRAGQRPDQLHHRPDRIGRRCRRHELGAQLRGGRGEHREHPVRDPPDPAQPAPHRRCRPARPAPRPADARTPRPWPATPPRSPSPRPPGAAAHSPVTAHGCAGSPCTSPAAASTDRRHAHRAPRAEPHGASRCPQPGAGQRSTPPHSAVSTTARSTPYRQHRCTPMHQDGPSVSAKTRGRAVAYPQDVLTLASHTTADKGRTSPLPGHHHDHPP